MLDFDLRWIVATFGLALGGATGCQIEDPARSDIDRMVEVACEQAESCQCGAPIDSSVCEERTSTWDARLKYARAEGLVYQPSCVETIEENIVGLGCGDVDTSNGHLCESYCAVFHGSKGEGEDCESFDPATSDCSQAFACVDGTCTTPCSALGGLAAGETCRDELGNQFDDCAENLECGFETRVCGNLPTAGQACSGGQCDTSSYCDWESNRCESRQPIGTACFDDSCEKGAFCDWHTQTCAAPHQEGETCRDGLCAEGLGCNYELDQCKPIPELGEPCGEVGCADGLSCRGVCVEPAGVGESCEDNNCQEELWCDWNIGRCAEHPDGEGQPCPSGECSGDLWCDNSSAPDNECRPLIESGDPCTGHLQCETSFCPAGFCTDLPQVGDSCMQLRACANGLTCDGTTCIRTVNRGSAVCSFEGW